MDFLKILKQTIYNTHHYLAPQITEFEFLSLCSFFIWIIFIIIFSYILYWRDDLPTRISKWWKEWNRKAREKPIENGLTYHQGIVHMLEVINPLEAIEYKKKYCDETPYQAKKYHYFVILTICFILDFLLRLLLGL